MSTPSEGFPRTSRNTPETLRLRRISPALTVEDIDKSLAWYRDVLGFYVEETWEDDGMLRGASLLAGSAQLTLSQDDWNKGRDRVKGQGVHLYLITSQEVDQVAADVRARGGTIESGPEDTPWGSRVFRVIDPDGYRLTVSGG